MFNKRMQVGQKKASDGLSLELWATMWNLRMNLGLLNDHQVLLMTDTTQDIQFHLY